MPVGQAEEIIALTLVFVVHVVGGLLLVWALLDEQQRSGWRRWLGGDGDDDGPSSGPQPQPPPEPGGGARAALPLPLPGGDPSRVRLRDDGRVADGYPRPARRPDHPPRPAPHPHPHPQRRPAPQRPRGG